MIAMARKVAASPSAVLIRGESGTGKELLAAAIHAASPRAGRPFVKVHCAALSQSLLESELFGHVKGAFTGADRDRMGRFEQANGGTLFLDEIGDINLEVQTKLLRVLQEMSFERVGSSQPITVDVRIVAATHQDLEALIRPGRFREDLYYRLNVICLHVAARSASGARTSSSWPSTSSNVHAERAGKLLTHIDPEAVEALMAHDWPGNIRELENVIERAVVLADGPAVTAGDLPPEVCQPPAACSARGSPWPPGPCRWSRPTAARTGAPARTERHRPRAGLGLPRPTARRPTFGDEWNAEFFALRAPAAARRPRRGGGQQERRRPPAGDAPEHVLQQAEEARHRLTPAVPGAGQFAGHPGSAARVIVVTVSVDCSRSCPLIEIDILSLSLTSGGDDPAGLVVEGEFAFALLGADLDRDVGVGGRLERDLGVQGDLAPAGRPSHRRRRRCRSCP